MRSVFWIVLVVCFAGVASAQVHQSLGEKWMNRLAPEPEKPPKFPVYFNDLDKLKSLVARGLYRQALVAVQNAAKIDPLQADLLKARAQAELGYRKQTIALLDSGPFKDSDSATALSAQILEDQGEYQAAIDRLDRFVKAHPSAVIARSQLGHVLLHAGQIARARDVFTWFGDDARAYLLKIQNIDDRTFASAEEAVAVGRALDQWATLEGRYRNNPQLNDRILNVFVKAYDVIDREYQPALLAAGEYLLRHGNLAEAQEDLGRAMEFNPYDVRTLELTGQVMASMKNIDAAEAIVQKLRAIDPDSVPADLLAGWVLIPEQRFAEARELARRAVSRQPSNIQALSLLAAVDSMRNDDASVRQSLEAIEKLSPNAAEPYLQIGTAYARLSRQNHAIDPLRQAVAREPWRTDARNLLGTQLMEDAREDEARAELEAARELDPFNVFTINYLRLLDQMRSFARIETEHFIFLCDKNDELIVREIISPYMEQAYAQVSADMRYQMPHKAILELFPTRQQFAVRTTGLPNFDNFGVSMGRLITSVMPGRDKNKGGFQWARVLKHEFTHTVNLTQTDGNIPRWLTEGLAVWEEKVEFRFRWVPPVLYRKATKGELPTLRQLQHAFFRARSPTDGEVAYMTGFWIVRHIDETYGREALLKLIDAYRLDRDDTAAFKTAIGKSAEQYDSEFKAWAKKQVADWGYDETTEEKVKKLVEQADGLTRGKKFDDAVGVWTEILKLQPKNPLAHTRLAGLYLVLKQPTLMIEHFKAVLPLELQDGRFAKRIARAYVQLDDIDHAIEYALAAAGINPFDVDTQKFLAELYEKKGDDKRAGAHRTIVDVLEQQEKARSEEKTN